MKQLSKMMLAAVASVAFAATAFAWDFGASGSSTASFNSTSTKDNKDANTVASGGVSASSSNLALASSHTDGTKTLALSYTLDWDGNLDETIALSGSSTVGGWTASGDISYNRDDGGGCSDRYSIVHASDNSSLQTAGFMPDNATNVTAKCGVAGEESSTAVTLTDGTMTIKLGNASHLSGQNVSSGSSAAGAVTFDTADDDAAVGAFVGSYLGVSLGYAISDTMSVTVAYQTSPGTEDACGAGESYDGELAANTAGTGAYGTTGTGFGFSGTFGIVAVGATVCNATTADAGLSTQAAASNSTATSTLGVGVTLDLGDIKPFLSFGTYLGVGSVSKTGVAGVGNEVGLTYALGSDTVVAYYGSVAEIATTGVAGVGVAADAITVTGMELGYNTTVGPVSVGVGYGTHTTADALVGSTVDGASVTDIEVALTYAF